MKLPKRMTWKFAALTAGGALLSGCGGSSIDFVATTPPPTTLGPVQEWVERFNGPGNDEDQAVAVVTDSAGNVYVTGHTTINANSIDICTKKYSPSGEELWEARYSGPGQELDRATALAVDAAGNVYVTGSSIDVDSTQDLTTIKYDKDGNQLWVSRYDDDGRDIWDYGNDITVDDAGNVYVTGAASRLETNFDFVTIKYNSGGTILWVARHDGGGADNGDGGDGGDGGADGGDGGADGGDGGGTGGGTGGTGGYGGGGLGGGTGRIELGGGTGLFGNGGGGVLAQTDDVEDIAFKVAVDNSGNVYVTGESEGATSNYDFSTVKYDSNGVFQWESRYPGSSGAHEAQRGDMAVDANGNVYVTGTSLGDNGFHDYATIKYDTDGRRQWVARYDGPGGGDDAATALAIDGAGNVYVTGESTGDGSGFDYATIRYDANGEEQWEARYDGPAGDDDFATGITLDAGGGVYVTGLSTGIGTGFDYATIKYAAAGGQQQWVARYDGPAHALDAALAIVYDAVLGYVYVTGGSAGVQTDLDMATIKYSQASGTAQ